MGSVAERSGARSFAAAQKIRLGLIHGEGCGGETGFYVGRVAERLVCTLTAEAPEIGLPSFKLHLIGPGLGDFGLGIVGRIVVHVSFPFLIRIGRGRGRVVW